MPPSRRYQAQCDTPAQGIPELVQTTKEPEYLTVEEAAHWLRIAPQTLRNRMSLNKISAKHGKRRAFGRVIFDRAVLKRALDNGDLSS
jgi:hypothetical protein